MALAKWRLKQLSMLPFACSAFTEDLYERLTAVHLGTQGGMSRKWCYWFREHVVLSRRYGRFGFSGKRIWLFEPGWSLAPVILSRLITTNDILVTEEFSRLSDRYVPLALEETDKVASSIMRSAAASAADPALLKTVASSTSAGQILKICRARYCVSAVRDFDLIDSGSFDACFSMGRLEHFDRKGLSRVLTQMRRILSPGGIASHIVDHRDHFWHFDKSIHCFHHLSFSDKRWNALAKGRHMYRNRLLERDYIRLFQDHGFEVLAAVHNLHRSDADGLDPGTLWGRFAELEPGDLEAAVTHFVVRRS
jgi:SAM-dependent methyltransferase